MIYGIHFLGRRKGEPLHCQPDGVLLLHRTNERNQPGGWSLPLIQFQELWIGACLNRVSQLEA